MNKSLKLTLTSILTAIGASLCCITPVLALISGASGAAATFSWMEPLRPYLIGITVLVLSFAWYQKLKLKKEIDCDCETDEKPSFMQSTLFLVLITVFSALMLAFPYYSSVFYSKSETEVIITDQSNLQSINIDIEGMTCTSCEEHINHSVNQLEGIVSINTSYESGNTQIEFDQSKTSIEDIEKGINSTGYSVSNIKKE